MKQYSDLEFLKLSKGQKFLYKLRRFFVSIPLGIAHFFMKLWTLLMQGVQALGRELKEIGEHIRSRGLENENFLFCHGIRQSGPGPDPAGDSFPAL